MVRDQLRINMFGRLSVQQGGRRISHFRTEKTGLLLACLAQDSHRHYRREELIERLWPDHDPESGRNCLRVALATLRQELEAESGERGSVLIADRQEIHLQPGAYTTDKAEFEENLLRATQARDDAARIRYLHAAVDQYQADLLLEYGDIWITAERQRLSEAYILALRRLVKAYSDVKNYDRALTLAQKAVQADPYREDSHRLLMQVFALAGRPAAALRQYRELETLLDSTLGSAPSRPTQTVMNQVCEQVGINIPTSSPGTRRSAVTVKPELPLPRRTLPRLPTSLSRLFGRDDAILQVVEMLSTPETRLVTLMGMGGIGKTRLALAVAEQIQTEAKQSVCFISFAGITRPDLILSALASHLQLPLRPRQDLRDRIIDVLSAEPFLLVLDNLEHLLPEGGVTIQRLLEATQTVVCLVTSRQRLNIPGEYAFTVRPLPLAVGAEDIAHLKTSPSVQLWLERAQAASSSFQITPANMHDVLALTRSLEGVPLAIELSAAWIGMLTPAQIVSRLNARFDLLVSRQPGIEARHASLRAALDWSYQLLPSPVQRFFARLGLFQGGWTLEAAEAVCEEAQALEYLAQLCERSLAIVEETGDGMRYRFLETVREYAESRLTGEDRAQADRQFSDYFLRLARMAEAGATGPEQVAWMQRLKDDEDNIRAVLKQVVEDPASAECSLAMAAALFRYWYTRGDSHEGRSWLSAALDHAPPGASGIPKALMALGNLACGEGDYPHAEACFKRCQALRSASGDTRGLAATLGSLGNVIHRQGDVFHARALLQQSLKLFAHLADRRGQALTHGNLANLAMNTGEAREALSHEQEALTLFRELGDAMNIMMALTNASYILLSLGEEQQVRTYLQESLALCLQLQSSRDLAQILAASAILVRKSGEASTAMELLGASARLRANAHVCLSAVSQEQVDSERQADLDLLGEAEGGRCWTCGYDLSEEAMSELARGILE